MPAATLTLAASPVKIISQVLGAPDNSKDSELYLADTVTPLKTFEEVKEVDSLLFVKLTLAYRNSANNKANTAVNLP